MTRPSDQAIALKPCPFCGGEAHVAQPTLLGGYMIHCDTPSCQAQCRLSGDFAKAAAAWNRRARELDGDVNDVGGLCP
jgi:Lar family restriction alleviation protein